MNSRSKDQSQQLTLEQKKDELTNRTSLIIIVLLRLLQVKSASTVSTVLRFCTYFFTIRIAWNIINVKVEE
jgi:hypothetical protein